MTTKGMIERDELPAWIPSNIKDYLSKYLSAVEMSVSTTDGLNGYGTIYQLNVTVSRHAECCDKCGYHSLFRKERYYETPLQHRHRWHSEWAVVFAYRHDEKLSIQDAFDQFLKANPDDRDNIKKWSNWE